MTSNYLKDRNLKNTVITKKGIAALRDLRTLLGVLSPIALEQAVLFTLKHERDKRGLYPTRPYFNSIEEEQAEIKAAQDYFAQQEKEGS